MDKNSLPNKIKKDIQDLYSLSGKFENTSHFHQIDIDLALSKVRNLYDLLLKLEPAKREVIENREEDLKNNEIFIEKEKEEKESEKLNNAVEKESIVEETPKKEPEFVIETPRREDTPEPKKKESIENSTNKSKDTAEIVAEKFQSRTFVHDTISSNNGKQDISSRMQSKPIKDINSAIGLNDKFIFIRELFKGDKDYYNETIQVLNNFDTYDNAIDFLNENFDWDEENTHFERLKELVRRKYNQK